MSCFFTDATGVYPGGVLDRSLLYVTARPATKAPVTRAVTYGGRRCTAAPNVSTTANPRTYRSLCCTLYDAYVPAWHITDGDDGAANGAGPSECTAGVTPAPSENLGTGRLRREQAPVPCTPRNGRRPHTIQGTCDDTASWPPRRPADGQQRAGPQRERVTGHQEGSRGLIIPSRRMFSTAPVRRLSSWCLRVSLNSTSAHQCPA